ncbi:type II toxin-antitoxin system HipA family toxin YjjJ [Chitinimonas arctica]|uniref:Type II toxin-antitoxin system HipA family toxin YjjJ n=1 Tax=Chitinimonas arctica TaxID=2594795 RepID=A0A516SLC1_9NEIS|nr:type II toxin-antitoxin system HipA family toxin YjjJ [Chitinimonas arctica]QDQ28960.1 type II toxin-antitoxin system HipA family toxin YjjJ [Chitinimonas arctica]
MPAHPLIAAHLLHLLRNGVQTAPALCNALAISQPTLSRLLQRLKDEGSVLPSGHARASRYHATRQPARLACPLPVMRIDEAGAAVPAGCLYPLVNKQWLFAAANGDTVVTDGLPFFIRDMRPQGLMDRAFPRNFPELDLPDRLSDWDDDQTLLALSMRGEDVIGDLIIGDVAVGRYLQESAHAIQVADCPAMYPKLAEAVISNGSPGSSAAGAQPKFSALLQDGLRHRWVWVKFSPKRNTQAGERWADLLVAEHLALRTLNTYCNGLAANSRILQADGRVFLEVDRFDRVGARGRRALYSAHALMMHYLGSAPSWTALADALSQARLISGGDRELVALLDVFGGLIANTDRHMGILSFHGTVNHASLANCRFQAAPIYDMLPMAYAPFNGELRDYRFDPPPATMRTSACWDAARDLALRLWGEVEQRGLISQGFRRIAADNAKKLRGLRAVS